MKFARRTMRGLMNGDTYDRYELIKVEPVEQDAEYWYDRIIFKFKNAYYEFFMDNSMDDDTTYDDYGNEIDIKEEGRQVYPVEISRIEYVTQIDITTDKRKTRLAKKNNY